MDAIKPTAETVLTVIGIASAMVSAVWFACRFLLRTYRDWCAARLTRAAEVLAQTIPSTATDSPIPVTVPWLLRPGARHLVETGKAGWHNEPTILIIMVDRLPFDARASLPDVRGRFGTPGF